MGRLLPGSFSHHNLPGRFRALRSSRGPSNGDSWWRAVRQLSTYHRRRRSFQLPITLMATYVGRMQFRAETPDGTLSLRNAIGSDADAIGRLYSQLSQQSGSVSVDPVRLEEIAVDPSNLLLVAERDGCIVATALLTLCLDAMYRNQPFGVVENIVVDIGHRSSGCGKALMEAIDHAAMNADCSKVMLLSANMREDAHAYFRAMGYDDGKKRGFVKYRMELASRARQSSLRLA